MSGRATIRVGSAGSARAEHRPSSILHIAETAVPNFLGIGGRMKELDIDHYRRREAEERAAAKRATNLAARRAHQELALLYATLVHPNVAWDYMA
jgi:hypothetical protein